jgi:hypothetical protein
MAMISDDSWGAVRLAVNLVSAHGPSVTSAELSSMRSPISVGTGAAITDVVDDDRLLFAKLAPVSERKYDSDGKEPRLARLAGRPVGPGFVMIGDMLTRWLT